MALPDTGDSDSIVRLAGQIANLQPAWAQKPFVPSKIDDFPLKQANDADRKLPIVVGIQEGGNTGSGGGAGFPLAAYACSGNMNGSPTLRYLYGPIDQ